MEIIKIVSPKEAFSRKLEYKTKIENKTYIINKLIDDFNYELSQHIVLKNKVPTFDINFTLFANTIDSNLSNECIDCFIDILKENDWTDFVSYHKWWSICWRLDLTIKKEQK